MQIVKIPEFTPFTVSVAKGKIACGAIFPIPGQCMKELNLSKFDGRGLELNHWGLTGPRSMSLTCLSRCKLLLLTISANGRVTVRKNGKIPVLKKFPALFPFLAHASVRLFASLSDNWFD